MPTSLQDLDLRGTGSCASFNFRRTARAVTRLYDLALQECGIRSTQFTILVAIAKTQPTSISALGNLLVIDPTTLTRSLKLLKKEGLVQISERSTRRQRFVSLAHKGEQALAKALPLWRQAHQRFLDAIGPGYWTNLQQELEGLARLTVSLDASAGS
jgi:DNA-binding MarR family transcriptional regulator